MKQQIMTSRSPFLCHHFYGHSLLLFVCCLVLIYLLLFVYLFIFCLFIFVVIFFYFFFMPSSFYGLIRERAKRERDGVREREREKRYKRRKKRKDEKSEPNRFKVKKHGSRQTKTQNDDGINFFSQKEDFDDDIKICTNMGLVHAEVYVVVNHDV